MNYTHKFVVDAPIADVIDFHSRSSSMGAITPPPIIAKVHSAPEILQDGDEMDFTLWLGPFPIRWLARIETVSPTSFIDEQLSGPFAKWEHQHTFVERDDGKTEVHDEINAELKSNLFWKFLGLGMWSNMSILFAFRGWKTRRILKKRDALQTA